VRRDSNKCTGCGACDDACLWGIRVSEAETVTSLECSNCQDCIKGCPIPEALGLHVGGGRP
jgi:Fe-S-cluster-containing dehydrogenase component